MSKVTLEELKEHCIKMIQKAKRLGFPEDSKGRQKHEIFLQLIREHEQRQSTDAVSRERLKECFHRNVLGGEAFDEIIDMQPPVTPERPKGKWLTPYGSYSYRLTTYKCSLCESETDNRSNYCPSCGAYMREVSE